MLEHLSTISHRPRNLTIFLLAYAAASVGMVVAYLPLIVLLLPIKAAAIDEGDPVTIVSSALLVGAITASIANIAAGQISDLIFARTESRIGQITAGLAATLASYWVFAKADSWTELLLAFALFQTCLNMFIAPLTTLLADKVPPHAKARGAAMFNLSLPIGSLVIAGLALAPFDGEHARLITIGMSVVALVAPVCFLARRQANVDHGLRPSAEAVPSIKPSPSRANADLAFAWMARFSVQIAGAIMFGYILLYLDVVVPSADRGPDFSAERALGQTILFAAPIAVIGCLTCGIIGDRWASLRGTLMMFANGAIAGSLTALVIWPEPKFALLAYTAVTAGITCYLASENAVVTQLLTRSKARARTLGIMNLANVLPSVLAPVLVMAMSAQGLSRSALVFLFQTGAVMALLAMMLSYGIRSARTTMR
jgi:MFS family permease